MAFDVIAASEVDSDSPITDTLMNKIRTNFDDHEERILAATQGGAVALRVVECSVNPATSGLWEKMAEVEIWIPAGITTLNCRARLKTSFAGVDGNVRMYIQASSTAGTEDTVVGTAYGDVDFSIDPDVADKGAWATIEFQGQWTSGGGPFLVYLHKDEETISGVLRNYAGASYFS